MNAQELVSAIGHLAARLAVRDALTSGDRAELRRMDPEDVLPPACWRLLTSDAVRTAINALTARENAERAFAVLIATMAEAGSGEGGLPVGTALRGRSDAERAYAESRFIRLLRARGLAKTAFEARQAARWCALNGRRTRFDGTYGFGAFVLQAALERDQAAERCAHAIARDYFRAPSSEPTP